MSRQNKANRSQMVQSVSIRSALPQFKLDNVLNFMIRYQATSGTGPKNVTRAQILDVLIHNTSGTTANFRLCAAVRINKITITTSTGCSLEWLSAYGPTSATLASGTSSTAAGVLSQRPAKNSLASAWSLSGSNETEPLFNFSCTTNDYIDVSYSVVLLDNETPVAVTTTNTGITGAIYRTYLDGPAAAAKMVPVFALGLF